jgi:ParB family transcriptional regulator, chromosome partitioning protein
MEREPERGGRPKAPKFARPASSPQPLANGVTLEMLRHEDGFSVRLRGPHVDRELTERLVDEVKRWLEKSG